MSFLDLERSKMLGSSKDAEVFEGGLAKYWHLELDPARVSDC
jgi:hypothetical protein